MDEKAEVLRIHGNKAYMMQQTIFQMVKDRKSDDVERGELSKKVDSCYFLCKEAINNQQLIEQSKSVSDRILQIWNSEGPNSEKCEFHCAFVCMILENDVKNSFGVFHVFSIKLANSFSFLVDGACLRYKSWDDCLQNNEWPKSHLFYPRNGKYVDTEGDLAVDVIYAKSVACSPKSIAKKVLCIASGLVGVIAAGILFFNPASPFIVGGAAIASVISIGVGGAFAYSKYKHIVNHKNGIGMNKDTLFLAGDVLLILGGGLLAVASACKLAAAAKVGTELVESSRIALYLQANLRNICIGVSSSTFILNLAKLVDSFANDTIKKNDIESLMHYMMFAFNFVASVETIKSILANFSKMGIEFLYEKRFFLSSGFKRLKKRINIKSYEHFMSIFFTDSTLDEIKIIRGEINLITKEVSDYLNGKVGLTPLISFLYKKMCSIQNNAEDVMYESKKKLDKTNSLRIVRNESDLYEVYKCSVQLSDPIEKTIKCCFNSTEDTTPKEKELIKFFKSLFRVNTNSVSAVNFYCCLLQKKYSALFDEYLYDYFEYINSNTDCLSRKDYIAKKYGVKGDISSYLFEKSCEKIREEYVDNLTLPSEVDLNPGSSHKIYTFTRSSLEGDFTKENIFILANQLSELKFDVEGCNYASYYEDTMVVLIPRNKQYSAILFLRSDETEGIMVVHPLTVEKKQ